MYHHSGSYNSAEMPVNGAISTNNLVTDSQGSSVKNVFNPSEKTSVNRHHNGPNNYGYSIPDLFTNTQPDYLQYNHFEHPSLGDNFRDLNDTTNDRIPPRLIANEISESSNIPKQQTDPIIMCESPKNNRKPETINTLDMELKNPYKTTKLHLQPSRRKNLEKTVRLIENIIVNSEKSVANTVNNDIMDPLNIKTEIIYNSDDDNETETNEDVNSNVTSQTISTNIRMKIEPDRTDCDPDIVVKIEPATIEQITVEDQSVYSNPFSRDCNGVTREHAGEFQVIDGSLSADEATSAVYNDIYPDVYYECGDCQLLFRHAKRFLIHNKWHSMHITPRSLETRSHNNEASNVELDKEDSALSESQTDKPAAGSAKLLPCLQCDKVFTTPTTLRHHQSAAHKETPHKCRICNEMSPSRTEYIKHLAGHRGTEGFQCPQCPKKFKMAHSLYKHVDMHLEKTHECNQCGRKYGSQALLKMHLKRHEQAAISANVTFSCTYCGKTFTTSYGCKVHESVHRNESRFTCDICKSKYRSNSSLVKHQRMSHSGTKPHVCSVCQRSFMKEITRDRHEQRAHGDPELMKFVCKLCPCRYAKYKDLQKHTYKVHPTAKKKKKDDSDSD